jgi:hypothetical protein
VVDDSEIKEGDWYYDSSLKQIFSKSNPEIIKIEWQKKITHLTQPPENERITNPTTQIIRDAMKMVEVRKPKVVREGLVKPIVELLSLQEVKELIGEMDVENKAKYKFPNDTPNGLKIGTSSYKQRGFISGYNQALEDNKKKKYTEEDLRMAFLYGHDKGDSSLVLADKEVAFQDYIQSLQPKTSWEVEIVDGKLKLK